MSGDLEQLGERIAEQAAHLDAAMHRLLADLREFDARGGWHVQGASSCAHWLAWRAGWDLVTARERVRVARRLGEFPVVDDALRRGELSYSKVRAIMRVATEANQALLLEYARLMTGAQLEKLCRKYALVQRHGQDPRPQDDEQRRYVRRRDTEDGMVKIEAVLHPEEAELVWTMLDHAAKQLVRDPELCRGDDSAESAERAAAGAAAGVAPGASALRQREDAARRAFSRADALLVVVHTYLRGERPDRAPIDITLTIPVESLRGEAGDPVEVGELGDSFISREVARRLSCDAGVVEVVEGEHGAALSVGRKRRTIAGAFKRALCKRDNGCAFPSCTHRVYLEGHHIKHWADGGETSLLNGCMLCSHHHRHVHEYGYTIELGPDQRPQFRDPHGRLVPVAPPVASLADLGWPRLRADNAPLAIDAQTIACEWDGTRVEYGTLVGHLVVADGLV